MASTRGKPPRTGRGIAKQTGTAKRIAEEALAILETEGPDAVSMRRIAQALNITPMAIYHHYPNREALLLSLVYDELATLQALADRAVATRTRGNRLVRIVDAYLDYAFERPHVFDYMFTLRRRQDVRYPGGFRAGRSPTLTPVADEIAAAMKTGELKKGDVWEIAMQLWAHAHGYVTMYRAGWFELSEKEFRALYHRAVKRLLDGLKA